MAAAAPQKQIALGEMSCSRALSPRRPHEAGLCVAPCSTAEDLWPGATQRPGHQLPCTVASCDGEALRQRSALRKARAHARTRAPAHTHAQERPTTNDATCGPPAWLTGSLHEGGIRSARSPPRRALSSRPLSPRPCKAAAPKGPAFCFLNYWKRTAARVPLRRL